MSEQTSNKNQDPAANNVSPYVMPGLSMGALGIAAAKGTISGGLRAYARSKFESGANTQIRADAAAPNTVNPALLHSVAEGAAATQLPTLPGPEARPPQAPIQP